jgi:chemotaxis protein methyltransferase CheR
MATASTSPPELASIQAIADQGDLERAAHACERLLQTAKLNPLLHFFHAMILEQMGRRRETQEALRRAIYLDRAFVIAHYYLGLIQQRLGRPKDAFRCFRNTLALLSDFQPGQSIPGADGITAGELTQLTQLHMEALPKS